MIKTLAMLKMEKNFVALLVKKYPRQPYRAYGTEDLMIRLREEVEELQKALDELYSEGAKKECADVSNIIDFIFERICEGLLR